MGTKCPHTSGYETDGCRYMCQFMPMGNNPATILYPTDICERVQKIDILTPKPATDRWDEYVSKYVNTN